LDSLKFRPLTQLLFRFKGNADWAIISDLPRACIITRLRVIPPDADAESLVAIAEDAAKRDIPKLSVYLNAAIGEAVRANGITVQPEPLELPLMHDAMDSPGVVYLVRDPTLFLESRLAPTSEYDRALHFWIGDQEEAKLREQLRVSDGEMSRLLNRLVNGSYGEAVINPEEVDQLLSECDYVNSASSDADIHAALIKIRSIANSAKNYRLGICLLGDS
jgi:hypothetical protein